MGENETAETLAARIRGEKPTGTAPARRKVAWDLDQSDVVADGELAAEAEPRQHTRTTFVVVVELREGRPASEFEEWLRVSAEHSVSSPTKSLQVLQVGELA